jgi:protocatechuate 3,4-dioxygenase beta subunit
MKSLALRVALLAGVLAAVAPSAPRADPPPSLGGAFQGTVRGGDGQPAAGAEVVVFTAPPADREQLGWTSEPVLPEDAPQQAAPAEPRGRATCDASGRYRVEGLPWAQPLVVQAFAPGHASAQLRRRPGAAFDPLDLALAPTHAVRVRIVDASGRPQSAQVRALRAPQMQHRAWRQGGALPVAVASTDAEGRTTLAGLASGRSPLEIVVPGRTCVLGLGVDAPWEEEQTFVVGDPHGATIRGVVRDGGGRPLPGARVRVATSPARIREEDPVHVVWATSDASGAWRVGPLAGRRLKGVQVSLAGHVTATSVEVGRRLAPDEVVEVDVVLGPGGALRGRVLDAQGRPLAGAHVRAGTGRAVSDTAGDWRIVDLPASCVQVVVAWPEVDDEDLYNNLVWDRDGAWGTWAEAQPGVERRVQDLRPPPEREVRGRVLDEAGRPVAGAWVVLSGHATRSAPDGSFVLRASTSERHHWLSAETATAQSDLESVPVHPDAAPLVVDVVVRPLGRIAARLVDGEGRPCPRVGVTLEGPSRGRRHTDADGRVAFERLLPGLYKLRQDATQRRHKELPTVEHRLAPGENATDLTLVIEPPRAVAGTVVDETGRPAVGVVVRLKADEPWIFTDRWGTEEQWWAWSTSTDGRGRFRIENLPPGGYWIEPDLLEEGGAVEAGREDLKLVWYRDELPEPDGPHVDRYNRWTNEGPVVPFEGRVVDAEGRPVAYAQLAVIEKQAGGTSGFTVSAHQGRFRTQVDPSAESLEVEVRAVSDASGRKLAFAEQRLEGLKPGAGPVEVRLRAVPAGVEAPKRISGRVEDEAGRPVPSVAVRAGQRGADWPREMTFAAIEITDAEGRFSLAPATAASWEISCAPGLPWDVARTSAMNGDADVRLRLQPVRWTRGRVVDEAGRPLPGVRVDAREVGAPTDGSETHYATTSFDGSFAFPALSGKAQLEVPHERSDDDALGVVLKLVAPVSASAGATDVLLRMRRAFAVRGMVVDVDGRSLRQDGEDVVVTLAPEPPDPSKPELTTEQSWHDTSWALKDVPPGRYRVSAESEHGRRAAPQIIEVPAKHVRLVLEGPPRVVGRLVGERASGFGVQLVGAGPQPVMTAGRAGADGAFALEATRDAPLTLYAQRPGDDRFGLRAGLAAPVEGLEVALEPGERIEGRVTGGSLPADPARVLLRARSSDGLLAWGSVEPDGRFVVHGLPPGRTWALHARVAGEAGWAHAALEGVASGAREVTLALGTR